MAFCNQCGNEIPVGAPFCPHCGAAQPMQESPQQQAYAPQQQQMPFAQPQQMRQTVPQQAQKSKKGLIIGLVCGGVALVAGIVVLLVLLLGKKGSYQVFVEDQLQGVFTEGQRVTLKYPLATDTSYTFFSDDVSFTEDYEDWTAILAFTMPAHDVTIHVNSRNDMQPQPVPEPDPEPGPTPSPQTGEAWMYGEYPVNIAFLEDTGLSGEPYEVFRTIPSEEPQAVSVAFGAREDVSDLTFYTGWITEFTGDAAVFEYQQQFSCGELSKGAFCVAEIYFAGDMPNNAFSYVDENDVFHSYMFGTNGMDGALYLEECYLRAPEVPLSEGMSEIGGHYISILVPEEERPLLSDDAYYYEVSDGADLTVYHRESGQELCRITVCNKNEIDMEEHWTYGRESGFDASDFYGYIREADGSMDYYVIRFMYSKEKILQNHPEYAEELSRLYDILDERSAPENLIIPQYYGTDGTRVLVAPEG